MSFRKEKKFSLKLSEMFLMQKNLKKIGMKELYPPRIINSCYFDNDNMKMFYDSEEGVLPRKKVRIRWYEKSSTFLKEIKISSIEGRYKYNEKKLDINNKEKILKSYFFDQVYGKITPKIIISYQRSYFIINKLRITFDKNIHYLDIKNNFSRKIKEDECVMEIKVPIFCGDDYVKKIIPYSTSRFSKYSRGIIALNIIN